MKGAHQLIRVAPHFRFEPVAVRRQDTADGPVSIAEPNPLPQPRVRKLLGDLRTDD